MFERVRRLFKAGDDRYVRDVAAILLRKGLDPADLEEIKSQTALDESSRIFKVLLERKLSAEDAAHAISLTLHLYRTTRHMAEAQGWPLRDERTLAEGLPRQEAYFLELLKEAAQQLDTKSRPAG